MEWPDLLPALLSARDLATEVRRWTDPTTPEGRRAALISAEADLLIAIMQAPWPVRLPLIGAAALVRIARG